MASTSQTYFTLHHFGVFVKRSSDSSRIHCKQRKFDSFSSNRGLPPSSRTERPKGLEAILTLRGHPVDFTSQRYARQAPGKIPWGISPSRALFSILRILAVGNLGLGLSIYVLNTHLHLTESQPVFAENLKSRIAEAVFANQSLSSSVYLDVSNHSSVRKPSSGRF